MKRKILNLVLLPWELLTSTSATWDKAASTNISKKDVRNQFVIPWIITCVIVTFVFKSLYSQNKSLEVGFINAIICAISLFGAYFVSKAICFWYLRRKYLEKYSVDSSDLIVGYSFAITFILEIIIVIFPGLFYLKILNIYTAYLIWEACKHVLKLNEEERGNVILVYTLAIIFSPIIISGIIHMMLPNA